MQIWLGFRRPALLAAAVATAVTLGSQAHAACYGAQQQLPPQAVADFLANPAALLAQYPNGGPQLISRIRDLVASDPGSPPGTDNSVVNALGALFANASPEQKANIGAGMGQAAKICVGVAQTLPSGSPQQQAYLNYINAIAAAANGDNAVRVAYTAVAGDVALGGTGGGAGGGGGGGGGGPGGGTGGTFSSFGTNGGTTTGGGGGTSSPTSSSFTGGGAGGGGSASITTTTTASGPVSQ
jgi:hypothetical protein